jgi:hypothetical protein
MNTPSRVCKRSEVEHIRKFLAYAKLRVNEARYYPPFNGYRYMVALALYSKCITVAEATLALLDAGFSDEAFGMTRTLVDIFITLHYIANNDTDDRARRYAEFSAKDSEVWAEAVKIYWPQSVQPLSARTLKIAATFRSPHRWSGQHIKDMALEPDTAEVDPATKKPAVHDFAYRVIYRWTSHYVHPTIGALRNHLVQAGRDNFTVRSRNGKDMSHMAAFNVTCYVVNTMICFYRCMGDPQPDCLANWAGALTKHIARRHN